tara:strand:+ start:978 stop:2159 length:1182 start_codon:yes stop_codon:yes gene_type:complete
LPFKIGNRDARRLWLDAQDLATPPVGKPDILPIVRRLGFVQLDTIRVVSRAHHHIIWSRNQSYREPMLNRLLAEDRSVFEHYTHDASVLPTEFYPMWQRQFRRLREKTSRSGFYKALPDAPARAAIRQRIADEGPLSTDAFDSKITGKRAMWTRPPHKLALDHMWYAGELATSHRENFRKFYDLTERVIPEDLRRLKHDEDVQIDWLCREALDRLAFGTPGEIQRFWEAMSGAEVRTWLGRTEAAIVPVEVQAADGSWSGALASADIELRLANAVAPTSRLRILNPFDPVIRDRVRLKRLFGFDYRVEMFVPAAKRVWGYYVYPLLEGDRFVGRMEIKADRAAGRLNVLAFWPEPGVKWSASRWRKLDAELARFARLAEAEDVTWLCDRPAAP